MELVDFDGNGLNNVSFLLFTVLAMTLIRYIYITSNIERVYFFVVGLMPHYLSHVSYFLGG